MTAFQDITRGRLAMGRERARLSGMTRGRLTERSQRLIEQRRAEEQLKHDRERQSRHREQAMIAGGVIGGLGGLAAAPLLASAFPALTTAGAVVGGTGLGTATGVSTAMFGRDVASGGMETATEMFGNLAVDWGDVLNGTVFKAGLMDPRDIPLSSLPGLPPGMAGVELPAALPKTKPAQTPRPGDVGAVPTATPETVLGGGFARPKLATLPGRRLAIEPYLLGTGLSA